MTIYDRLLLELNNQQYFNQQNYLQFLDENGLNYAELESYDKLKHQKKLLLTVIDILEAVSNDIDLCRKVADTTTGLTIEGAYKLLSERITDIKRRVSVIVDEDDTLANINVRPLFKKVR